MMLAVMNMGALRMTPGRASDDHTVRTPVR